MNKLIKKIKSLWRLLLVIIFLGMILLGFYQLISKVDTNMCKQGEHCATI